MTAKSFTVYVDATSTSTAVALPTAKPILRSRQNSSVLSDVTPGTQSANKENFHPVSGEVPYSSSSKKRKTGALTPKSIPSHIEKLQDDNTQAVKKRKSVTTSRTKKTLRKGSKSAPRRTSPMPPLQEEEGDGSISSLAGQAAADSRCYELTVLPLADVSEAYCATTAAVQDDHQSASVKNMHQEEQEGFTSTSFAYTGRKTGASPAPPVFTTPERKYIASAFTFTSPTKRDIFSSSLVPSYVSTPATSPARA